MSEAKFTPGPWSISKKYVVGPRDKEYGQSYGMIVGVADVYGDNRSANAHLIAAAPELYECLEFLCAWLKGQGFGDTSDKALPGEYDYAIEVLAKARGET